MENSRRFTSLSFFQIFHFRLESGLGPLENDVSAKRSELSKTEKNLEDKTEELERIQQKMDASSKLLK